MNAKLLLVALFTAGIATGQTWPDYHLTNGTHYTSYGVETYDPLYPKNLYIEESAVLESGGYRFDSCRVRHLMPMRGFVYILQSEKSGRYYIGSTKDPDRRFYQHQNDLVLATRNKGPWKRAALIEFLTPTIARKAEYHLKRQKNRRAIEQVITGTYPWPTFDG